MKFDELIVLLPCHSLEDFPVHQEGAHAGTLLAAWSGLWHPNLLASAQRLPTWHRADSPPAQLAGRLLVIPSASEYLLQVGWAERAQAEGAHVVRKFQTRDELLAQALVPLNGQPPIVDPDFAADFLALGLSYLLVELLTRQMRYMSNIDEAHLKTETLAAAAAAVEGNHEAARDRLRNCFGVLVQARERFYPVAAYMIDLTLVARTTLGAALRRELAEPAPKSLLISAGDVAHMALHEPATLEALRLALDHGTASLVGGEGRERELPLLPSEAILCHLRDGAAMYARHLGQSPTVFGRRRYGLTPLLPQLLGRLGFQGALHVTLDDGQFPRSGQCKTRWEGLDHSAIDALTRIPLDANRTESLLSLPRKLGESMDLDHVATVLLVHWPGAVSPYYNDLKRVAAYGPVLGKFVTLDEYFARTDRPGELTRFKVDQYRSPYLQQAVERKERNPLSRYGTYNRLRARAVSYRTLMTLASLVRGTRVGDPDDLIRDLDLLESPGDSQEATDREQRLEQAIRQAVGEFSRAVTGASGDETGGFVVANPQSFARRVGVTLPMPAAGMRWAGPVLASQAGTAGCLAVVEVPPLGFAWIGQEPASAPSGAARSSKRRKEPNLIENEHLQVAIDPTTGGIQSVRLHNVRGNRMSQRLAMRMPGPRPKPGDIWRDPDEVAEYSVMVADRVETTAQGPALHEVTSRGRLVDLEGNRLAGFEQAVRLWHGARVVQVEINLDPGQEPRSDPWNSYYASRFAYGDEAAELRRSVDLCAQPTEAKRLEAPHFIEVRSGDSRTTILTGGLCYHRRVGMRMVDVMLAARGDTQRRFRLGIGVDVPNPAAAALDLEDSAWIAPVRPPRPGDTTSGWLFHIDARQVVATHWEPLEADHRLAGFRVRLLETAGIAGRIRLRAFRPLVTARQVDFRGEPLLDLPVQGDAITIDCGAFEWIEVEARWA